MKYLFLLLFLIGCGKDSDKSGSQSFSEVPSNRYELILSSESVDSLYIVTLDADHSTSTITQMVPKDREFSFSFCSSTEGSVSAEGTFDVNTVFKLKKNDEIVDSGPYSNKLKINFK